MKSEAFDNPPVERALLSTSEPPATTLVHCPNQTVPTDPPTDPRQQLKQLVAECRAYVPQKWFVLLSLSDQELEKELSTLGARELDDEGVLPCLERLARGACTCFVSGVPRDSALSASLLPAAFVSASLTV